MVRYFTVITNLILALIFTGIALGNRRCESGPVVGGVTLAIILVGVIYGLLLQGSIELSGGAAVADLLLHKVTPILGVGYWAWFQRKGQLRPIHPWIWTLLPLAYFPYALLRGAIEGRYAYPFMDVDRIGWPATLLNGTLIACGFLIAGFAMFWIDRRLATGKRWG
ncbi:MAG: Pr6Pr family membrane protein [Sphingomicrobium sp.]